MNYQEISRILFISINGVVNYYSLKTFKKVNRGYVKIES